MFCTKCGTHIPANAKFCIKCGEKAIMTDNSIAEQQLPVKSSVSKAKKYIWFGCGAVFLLAVAALLIFVVFAGGAQGPLLGNTIQTKFINDCSQVFEEAFSDMSTGTLERIMTEPFDVEMDIKYESNEAKEDIKLEMAYDLYNLGIKLNAGSDIYKMLLSEDMLYIELADRIHGLKFESDEDLQKPMPLEERLLALSGSLSQEEDFDNAKLLELLINSIEESCFETSRTKTTLEMDKDDICDMLNSFDDTLKKDEQLKDTLNDLFEQKTGDDLDISGFFESAEKMDEIHMVFDIEYENSKPAGLKASLEDENGSNIIFEFDYKKDKRKMDFELYIESYDDIETQAKIYYGKNADGFDYKAFLSYLGETVVIKGEEQQKENEFEGEITIEQSSRQEFVVIEYDGEINFGMPHYDVNKDRRFMMETDNADIADDYETFIFNLIMGDFYDTDESEDYFNDEPEEYEEIEYEKMKIGIVLPENDGYYELLLNALEEKLTDGGYEISAMFSHNDLQQELISIEDLIIIDEADAIILEPAGDITASVMIAQECGVMMLLLSDSENETNSAVIPDFKELGFTAGFYANGDIFIINREKEETVSQTIESSFLDAVENKEEAQLLGIDYSNCDSGKAVDITQNMLMAYPGINNVACFDPNVSAEVFKTLNNNGFCGNFICYADEAQIEEMKSKKGGMQITFLFFTVDDIAQECVRQMESVLSGMSEPYISYLPVSVDSSLD